MESSLVNKGNWKLFFDVKQIGRLDGKLQLKQKGSRKCQKTAIILIKPLVYYKNYRVNKLTSSDWVMQSPFQKIKKESKSQEIVFEKDHLF